MDDQALQIDKYLKGELKDLELKEFEQRLQEDVAFAQTVKLYQEIDKGLGLHFTDHEQDSSLRESIKNVGNKYFEDQLPSIGQESISTGPDQHKPNLQQGNINNKARTGRTRRLMLLSAIAASIVFAFMLLRPWAGTTDPQQLYSQYYSTPDWDSGLRGTADEKLTALERASLQFNQRKFQDSEENLQQYLTTDSDDPEASFFLAVSKIEQGEIAEAIPMLKNLSEGESSFRQIARWYLALSYLKTNQPELAVEALRKVVNTDRNRATKAAKILEQLDR